MRRADALLVPLGVPRAPPPVPVPAPATRSLDEEDAWSDSEDDDPVWSSTWFHVPPPGLDDDEPTRGHACFATGHADGTVSIYARHAVRVTDVPPAPAERPQGGMTRRAHRRHLERLVAHLSPHASDDAPQAATVGMSQATSAPAELDENTAHQAEDSLESQASGAVRHTPPAPTSRWPPPPPRSSPSPPPTFLQETSAPMVPTTRWTLDDGVWTRLLRLHPQDASRVLSMHAQDSLLIVYQASERLSVWDVRTMSLVGESTCRRPAAIHASRDFVVLHGQRLATLLRIDRAAQRLVPWASVPLPSASALAWDMSALAFVYTREHEVRSVSLSGTERVLGTFEGQVVDLLLRDTWYLATTDHVVCADITQAMPSPVERLVDLGSATGVVCDKHMVHLRSTLHVEDRPTVPHVVVPIPGALAAPLLPASCAPGPLPWTCVWPQSLQRLIVALSHGRGVADMSLDDMLMSTSPAPAPASASRWDSDVSLLQIVTNPRTGTRHLLGGTPCGDVGVWNASTLRLEAAWSCFTAPVQTFVPLTGLAPASRFFGCVMCVASDGTAALLALDDVRLVHLFPSAGALTHVAVRDHAMALVYADAVHSWDMTTGHLQRTAVVPEHTWPLSERTVPSGMLVPSGCADASAVLLANVHRAMDVACRQLHVSLDACERAVLASVPLPPPTVRDADVLTPIITVLAPLELDPVFRLGAATTTTPLVGYVSGHTVCLPCDAAAHVRFTTSPEATAEHLVLTTALGLLYAAAVDAQAAQQLLHALLTPAFMSRIVRPASFVFPSLPRIAHLVLDDNEAIRAAARLVFVTYARAAPPHVLAHLEHVWAPHLPTVPLTDVARVEEEAVLVLGLVCSERYAYFPPALLRHVARLVLAFLAHATPGTRQTHIALELCAGCHVWQHYIDTVDLVRRVFCLATQDEGHGLRGLARRATLALAEKHSTLFMSTLAMDILHAPSVEQSQVTQRLVAFMIHQKPLVLYPSLPRLAEAVVRSLDPTHVGVRSSLAKSATLMINELVRTYPMIAFHGASQRLAVGTPDGFVVMYDLKSGTRMYVLDGHKRAVTACTFSPDGRRFLSMSLDEQVVLLWRLHGGFMDMFRPTSATTHTYRTIELHLGAAAQLSPIDTLRHVSFEWHDEHSVRLGIGHAHVNVGVV